MNIVYKIGCFGITALIVLFGIWFETDDGSCPVKELVPLHFESNTTMNTTAELAHELKKPQHNRHEAPISVMPKVWWFIEQPYMEPAEQIRFREFIVDINAAKGSSQVRIARDVREGGAWTHHLEFPWSEFSELMGVFCVPVEHGYAGTKATPDMYVYPSTCVAVMRTYTPLCRCAQFSRHHDYVNDRCFRPEVCAMHNYNSIPEDLEDAISAHHRIPPLTRDVDEADAWNVACEFKTTIINRRLVSHRTEPLRTMKELSMAHDNAQVWATLFQHYVCVYGDWLSLSDDE